jgi:hypothetical protein
VEARDDVEGWKEPNTKGSGESGTLREKERLINSVDTYLLNNKLQLNLRLRA